MSRKASLCIFTWAEVLSALPKGAIEEGREFFSSDMSKMPLVVNDVTADGSCFYRALYNAARCQGPDVLKRLASAMASSANDTCWERIQSLPTRSPIYIDGMNNSGFRRNLQEEGFVKCTRKVIGLFCKINNDENAMVRIHKNWMNLMSSDYDTLEFMLSSQPSWLRDAFYNNISDQEGFLTECSEHMLNFSSWAGEHEVKLISHILNKFNIRLIVLVNLNLNAFDSISDINTNNNDPDRIVLCLYCRNETHYNYLTDGPCEDLSIQNGSGKKSNTCEIVANPAMKKTRKAGTLSPRPLPMGTSRPPGPPWP
jgi:hypothetical protein